MYFQIFFYIINRGEGLTYGNFKNDQERFNYGLEELGLIDEEKTRLLRKYSKLEDEEKIKQVKSIQNAEDLINFKGGNK